MKLYEYAIIFHGKPTKKQEDAGDRPVSRILKDITRVLANDEREVLMLAAREIPTEYTGRLEQIDIAVRPF